jgi:hypothetical protein
MVRTIPHLSRRQVRLVRSLTGPVLRRSRVRRRGKSIITGSDAQKNTTERFPRVGQCSFERWPLLFALQQIDPTKSKGIGPFPPFPYRRLGGFRAFFKGAICTHPAWYGSPVPPPKNLLKQQISVQAGFGPAVLSPGKCQRLVWSILGLRDSRTNSEQAKVKQPSCRGLEY